MIGKGKRGTVKKTKATKAVASRPVVRDKFAGPRAPSASPFLYVINLKAYPGTWGPAGRQLVRSLAEVAADKGVNLILCVPATEIQDYSANLGITVFAQQVLAETAGAHTGALLPEMVKTAGASGTLLNHSEWPYDLKALSQAVQRCRTVGLTTIACARDLVTAQQLAGMKPDYIAYEPPEFIGNDKISVSQAAPDTIKRIVEQIKCSILVGAGIHSRADVVIAQKLGAQGILVASHVMTAADPARALVELII